jgi:hypothetical protein
MGAHQDCGCDLVPCQHDLLEDLVISRLMYENDRLNIYIDTQLAKEANARECGRKDYHAGICLVFDNAGTLVFCIEEETPGAGMPDKWDIWSPSQVRAYVQGQQMAREEM